jgi:hypothetical protein
MYLLEMNISCNLFNGAFDAARMYETRYRRLCELHDTPHGAAGAGGRAGARAGSS